MPFLPLKVQDSQAMAPMFQSMSGHEPMREARLVRAKRACEEGDGYG